MLEFNSIYYYNIKLAWRRALGHGVGIDFLWEGFSDWDGGRVLGMQSDDLICILFPLIPA